jgi:hypothetical protein
VVEKECLEKSGLRKTGSLQIQSFNLSNAFCVVSDHLTLFGTFFFVRSVKGTDMSENCVMNFLLKPIKVKWSDTTQKAFDKLKDCICSDPVLRSPDFSIHLQQCSSFLQCKK